MLPRQKLPSEKRYRLNVWSRSLPLNQVNNVVLRLRLKSLFYETV